MQNILNKLYQFKSLSKKNSYQLFKLIISGKIKKIQLTSILIAMKMKGESIDEITGAVNACLEKMKFFPKPKYLFADISGTGGDKNNTINISTASAFIAAECGFKIIKHCNSGISRKSGSSDLLRKFNINLNASAENSYKTLEKLNICFLFAPNYHNGFKFATNVRKELKTKTIFNLLGPLLNPANPPLIVVGVYNKKLIKTTINILKNLKYKRAIVLHGNNTDEVTLSSITYISELLDNGKIISYTLTPKDFGIKTHSKKIFLENSLEENYQIINEIMKGKGDKLYEELIAVNVAILLKVFGYEDLKKNTELALTTIRSGNVYKRIKNVAEMLKEDKT